MKKPIPGAFSGRESIPQPANHYFTMLSPYTLRLLLKHFDAIDRAVTRYMTYPRPKDEEQLTGTLIDLLDEQVQISEKIDYPIVNLREDLAKAIEPLNVSYALETHKYTKEFEGKVSQADLGLIVKYENHFEPELSSQRSWLIQAKRAYPTGLNPTTYEARAKFGAIDPKQEQRIRDLVKFVDKDFFRYLLYCPRPKTLDKNTREELSYFRNKALRDNLFDFAYGLEMRDDILNGSETIAAGMYISPIDGCPKCLGEVHASILERATPFSWFLIQHIPHGRHEWVSNSLLEHHEENELVSQIVRGDPEVVNIIANVLSDKNWNGQLLPPATLTIKISIGSKRDRFRWESMP
jgi:hypothetical protein